MKDKLLNYFPKSKDKNNPHKLQNITNQELFEELRTRIIARTIEIEWEDTYGDSSTITDLLGKNGKKWVRLNFDEALREQKKLKKKK